MVELTNPIRVPRNPFWEVARRFGRDESIAMVINVAVTAIVAFLTGNPLFLALAGPIAEKLGFFPAHFHDAYKVYKTTPERIRKPLAHYNKKAVRGGMKSLLEDILIHDPFYILFMYVGITMYPETPAWIMAAVSFIVAVVIVAVLEVAYTETCYLLFRRKMKRIGFSVEDYYEARFVVSAEIDPAAALNKIADVLKLSKLESREYNDTYIDAALPDYAGRHGTVRLRERTEGAGTMKTVQIVYTRASEQSKNKLDQYRYFLIKKQKLYHTLDQPAEKIADIDDFEVRNYLASVTSENTFKVNFTRVSVRDDDLLVTVDAVKTDEPVFILEIKTYKNLRMLISAMRYVMEELPLVLTTAGKRDILI